MQKYTRWTFAIIFSLFLISELHAKKAELQTFQGEARLLRFPTIHQDQVVFTYAGDLYTVASKGGIARRLTSHDGFEMFPRFSPDGKQIAFTAHYDGNTEVYVMPSQGGVPKRLTFTATLSRDDVSDRMGPNNLVMGWTNDSKRIIFRSRRISFNSFLGQLFTVSIDGGLPEQVPVPHGGFCSFSPDDSKLAYNRVFREFRTWKRYRGGMADDIWILDLKKKKVERLVEDSAQDIIPMWHGDDIYFLSDRDENQRMNLYVINTKSKETKQLTEFEDFDIKFPSLGKGGIVYENGGWIYRFDPETGKSKRLEIQILEDHSRGRRDIKDLSGSVTNYEISPDGKRALFGARGDVFTVPASHGFTRNLTESSGVHERNSKWSPNGKWIAYISDASGEDEIYIEAQDGSGKPKQLTTGADTYKYELYWSPDSKKIAWSDKKLRLQYVEVESKKVTVVTQAKAWEIRSFAWSPDSKWLTYAKPEVDTMSNIYIYSLKQGKSYPITDGWYSASSPAFSGDGKYLFFVSDRDFNPRYSSTEWNHAYHDMSRIYFVTLSKDTPSPFKPRNDETVIEEDKKEEKKEDQKKEKKEKKEESKDLKVDIDGIQQRILALPVKVANYGGLTSVGDSLYYIRRGMTDSKPAFQMYDLSDRKETALGSISGYEISANEKKMLVSQGGKYGIIDLPKGPVKISKSLDLSGMKVQLNRHEEWSQIFHECWRQMKHFFYDANMHGVDWLAMKKKYEPLVKHVNHRKDLTYIIGEMISELNAGHAYVGGGEVPTVKKLQTGLLGAQLERDEKTGFYKIVKILKGENWRKSLRSPLTELGVNVKEGQYITAVNGKSTADMNNIYESLVGTVDEQVRLKVNDEPKEQGSREVTVQPIADESGLYYFNWVRTNIEKVNKATNGKVGYIHVPDMQQRGLNEFVKHFYPQLTKKALIIDVRGNGGGNVSPMLIERLRREIVMITIARNTVPDKDPSAMIYGPKVCLMNEFSASDGDLFPYRFKHYKLGKLIGKRSWGGVVGIRGPLPLLDGGQLFKPEFSRFDLAGKKWIIEGYGVDPDIVVDNDPVKEFMGIDQQLQKGIEVIKEELKGKEWKLPEIPTYPKR